jgi:hypothetical protein
MVNDVVVLEDGTEIHRTWRSWSWWGWNLFQEVVLLPYSILLSISYVLEWGYRKGMYLINKYGGPSDG